MAMKIVPEQKDDVKAGYMVKMNDEEVDEANQRISSTTFMEKKVRTSWFLPAEQDLGLLFFRQIFGELRVQAKAAKGLTREVGKAPVVDDDDVPIEAFQRAFERLFYILGDDEPFDATSYDENGNGFVGWSEFSYVFKKRNIRIKFSLPERIYLTFDNPDSSYLAQIVSAGVLLTIIVSSLCFILSTAPEFQKEPVGIEKPKPEDLFDIIENVCLGVFVVEYIIRLSTCWAVNTQIFDKSRLLELTVGYEIIEMPTKWWRMVSFVLSLSNIIDLVAILPGVIGWLIKIYGEISKTKPSGMEGGAFVVLRLVRLTRIFRAFKNPKLVEPVIVIAQTISNSTKALYVLAFNLMLGILISGSLMWLCEKGDWDYETRKYNRYVGQEWNATSREWQAVIAESPFLSIPHAFWWAVVTATTVGYGDMSPTTTGGWIVGAATMMYSMVILALPVGVIGGNFTQAWAEYTKRKQRQLQETEKDKQFITMAIQRIDPFAMSTLMMISIWHERFPCDDQTPAERIRPREGLDIRPDPAEFLGEVCLNLDLPLDHAVEKTMSAPLQNRPDSQKRITGTLDFQYEWKPDSIQNPEEPLSPDSLKRSGTAFPTLKGVLKVTIIGANGLLNLSWTRSKKTFSNPYCQVLCYPVSPEVGETLRPACWRTHTFVDGLNPRFEASHSFTFRWKAILPSPGAEGAESQPDQTINGVLDVSSASSTAVEGTRKGIEDDVMVALKGLCREVTFLRDEVGNLNSRMDRAAGVTSRSPPPPVRENSGAPVPSPEPTGRWAETPATKDRPPSASGLERPPVLPNVIDE